MRGLGAGGPMRRPVALGGCCTRRRGHRPGSAPCPILAAQAPGPAAHRWCAPAPGSRPCACLHPGGSGLGLAAIRAPRAPGRSSHRWCAPAPGSRSPGRLSPRRGFGLAACSIQARLRPRSPLRASHLRLSASSARHPAPRGPGGTGVVRTVDIAEGCARASRGLRPRGARGLHLGGGAGGLHLGCAAPSLHVRYRKRGLLPRRPSARPMAGITL